MFDLKRVFTLTCCDGQTNFQVSPSLPSSSSNIDFYFIYMFVKLQKKVQIFKTLVHLHAHTVNLFLNTTFSNSFKIKAPETICFMHFEFVNVFGSSTRGQHCLTSTHS